MKTKDITSCFIQFHGNTQRDNGYGHVEFFRKTSIPGEAEIRKYAMTPKRFERLHTALVNTTRKVFYYSGGFDLYRGNF